MPQTDLEIRWTILFHNPFYHPAVAFRRSCFEKADRYRPEEAVSYDHYLWFDMLPFCRARNLADRLTQYRCNPRGLTSLYAIKPRNRTHRIREALWQRLGLVYDVYDDDLAADVSTFVKGEEIGAPERRFEAYRVILKVLRAFISCGPVRDGQDAAAGRRLAQQIVTRMLAMRRRQSKRLGSSTGCAGSSLRSERPFNGRGSEQRWQRFVAADKHRSQPHSFADAIAKLGKWLVPRRGLEPPRLASLVPETSASTNSATWARASLTDRATPLSIPAWPCWHAWEAHVQSLCNTKL